MLKTPSFCELTKLPGVVAWPIVADDIFTNLMPGKHTFHRVYYSRCSCAVQAFNFKIPSQVVTYANVTFRVPGQEICCHSLPWIIKYFLGEAGLFMVGLVMHLAYLTSLYSFFYLSTHTWPEHYVTCPVFAFFHPKMSCVYVL